MKYDTDTIYEPTSLVEVERNLYVINSEDFIYIFSFHVLIAIVERKLNRIYISNSQNFTSRIKAHLTKTKRVYKDNDQINVEQNYLYYKFKIK